MRSRFHPLPCGCRPRLSRVHGPADGLRQLRGHRVLPGPPDRLPRVRVSAVAEARAGRQVRAEGACQNGGCREGNGGGITMNSSLQAREVLSKNGMETESLTVLQQGEEDCKPPTPGEGFHGAVQRAGDVINQGVQAVKDGAVKLYNKVGGDQAPPKKQ